MTSALLTSKRICRDSGSARRSSCSRVTSARSRCLLYRVAAGERLPWRWGGDRLEARDVDRLPILSLLVGGRPRWRSRLEFRDEDLERRG
eukprot:1388791-Pyramimonas_sp.AAC.1